MLARRPLETNEVFLELISQRLSQGFQLIILPNKQSNNSQECLLSIGRIFHKIILKGSTITVTGYRPRHPYPTCNIHYRYRLQTPDHTTHEVSWVDFNAEKLENYNWNHLDHYICTRGDRDFALTESLKYWRLRLCVLPTHDSPFSERILKYAIGHGQSFPILIIFSFLFSPDFSTRASIASSTLTWPRRRGPGRLRFATAVAVTGSPIGLDLALR